MKVLYSRVVVLLVGLCVLAAAFDARAEGGASAPAILLVPIGDVDITDVNRVAAYVAKNWDVPVKIQLSKADPEPTMVQQVVAIAKTLKRPDICVVALAAMPAEVKKNHIVRKELRAAVVNCASLRPKEWNKARSPEQFGRRLEKETMRCIGLLIGMEECIWPRCALSSYQTEGQLDSKGRNFCPPCKEKAQRTLAERGVPMPVGGSVSHVQGGAKSK